MKALICIRAPYYDFIEIKTDKICLDIESKKTCDEFSFRGRECIKGSALNASKFILEQIEAHPCGLISLDFKREGDKTLVHLEGDELACSKFYLRLSLIFSQAFPGAVTAKARHAQVVEALVTKLDTKPQRDPSFSLFPSTLEGKTRALRSFLTAELESCPPTLRKAPVIQKEPVEEIATFEEVFDKIDFLRRIKPQERREIMKQVEALDGPLTSEQLDAFLNGTWRHPIFLEKDWPLRAFRAFLDGDLDVMQTSKLFLYHQCLLESPKEHPVRTYQLYNESHELDTEARELLETGLGKYYTEYEKGKVYSCLSHKRPHETQFFAVESPIFSFGVDRARELLLSHELDIAAQLLHLSEFSFLLVQEGPRRGVLLVIPPALLFEILQCKFDSTTMMPNPILGFFNKERLSIHDRRAIAIPFSGVYQPTTVHKSFSVSPLTLYYHDASYHLFIESGNVHRKAWIELAEVVKPVCPQVVPLILDREFLFYSRREIHVKDAGRQLLHHDEMFWYSLSGLIIRAQLEKIPLHEKILPAVVDHIVKHAPRWTQDFDIDISNLPQIYLKERPIGVLSLREIRDYYTDPTHK